MPHIRQRLVRRLRGSHRAIALVAVLSGAGCSTAADVDALRDTPPAPLVVLVDWDSQSPATVELRYAETATSATTAELGELLAAELRLLDASSRVCTRSDLGDAEPDLRLTFRPQEAIAFEHVGTARFVAAGGLWLVTWIGGLLVDDSTYSVASMRASCRYTVGDEYVDRDLVGEEFDLSFLERNDLFSWPGLQSLVLPPFWTTDQLDTTTDALKRAAVRVVARQVARELKTGFEQLAPQQFRCSVTLVRPGQNGVVVTGRALPIELLIACTAMDPVSSVVASVNGGAPQPLDLQDAGLGEKRASGNLTGLDPTRANWVRLTILADKEYTRTLRLGPQDGR